MNLLIKNLSASIKNKQILKNITLEIYRGKIHALMGPNGSGKSTLAQVLMGHPAYQVTSSNSTSPSIKIGQHDLLSLSPDKRAKQGLFLAFQTPVNVPGVNVSNLMRTAYQELHQGGIRKNKKSIHNPALNVMEFNELLFKESQKLNIHKDFLRRSLNEDFSGGEKKKMEMLQALMISPKFAIFDEIDTGLDIDALKTVAGAISQLKNKGCGVLLITHYQRILKYVVPDYVYILINGEIKGIGSYNLAKLVEQKGYQKWLN